MYDFVFTCPQVAFVIAGSARLNEISGFNLCLFVMFANWILLYCLRFSLDSTVVISIFAGFSLWWISLHFCCRCMTLFSLVRRLALSFQWPLVEVQGSTKRTSGERVIYGGWIVLKLSKCMPFAGFKGSEFNIRWIQLVRSWCILVFAVVWLLVEGQGLPTGFCFTVYKT